MFGLTSEALAAFDDANGTEYPFNELSTTRRGYRCRWILLTSPCDHNVLRIDRMPRFHAIPSHCFSDKVLQEMIITGKGIPFPDEMSNVLDVMERWGRDKCSRWYDCTVRYMAWRLKNKMWSDRKCLYFSIIKIKVKDMVDRNDNIPDVVFYQWVYLYYHWFLYDTHDYFELALRSLHFVRSMGIGPSTTQTVSSAEVSVVSSS